VDKFEAITIATSPPAVTSVPLIEGCAAHLECRLHKQVETGDHSIFVGEVVAAHVPDEPIRKLDNFAGNFAVAEPVQG
jgi:flavin reductase (DIM6/NTAB) family NADH-FMN oxidoreductase RutF